MKKITNLFLFIFLLSYSLNAQLVVGESGSVEIKNGASIEVAGLEISPAADYVINSGTSVTADLTPITINGAESMDRHYDVVAPLSDFIGSFVFNYNEEDMNGVSHEADLQVLDSEGGSWMNYADMDDTDFSVSHTFETSVNIHSVTASAIATITPIVAPWSDDFEDGDVTDWTQYQAADASTGWTLLSTGEMSHTDDNVATGVDNYFISPLLDCTGLTAPLLTYTEYQTYSTSWYDYHSVSYSTDYDGTNAATATWTELVNGSAAIGSANAETLEFAIPNTATAVAFRYMGDYADNWFVDDVSVTETPTDPAMEVSATTSVDSATFSFALENFTVGAAAGEGDGHIHYSLNGGAEVMVYSSDDLTLSGLPNGDHTIVFSLVDPNHAPLDPAVEATVEFSTFNACGETMTYTQVANGNYSVGATAGDGEIASVTVTATMENNYDFLYVTDGAGNALTEQTTGSFDGVTYSSSDGTINVQVTNDGSVQNGDVTLVFTCAPPQTLVTLTVNTANIIGGVGENGMYAGGGILGNAMAYPMSDDDGDGTYEVTISLDTGATGNYIFINSPANGDDYSGKENLEGQECADGQWNDRLFPEITGESMTLQHCFGSCETDGTCPVAPSTYDVTFSIDPSNYNNGAGIADTDQLYVSGSFNGWSGEANPMSDDDGDGIWETTITLADGDYQYKFTLNNWAVQEEFGAIGVVEGCTVADGGFTNRGLTVAGEDMVLPTVYWNLCPGETPGEVYNVTFNLDATAIDVGTNGMFMGGGFLGGANAVPMADDDGDGIWTATIEVSTDQIGLNYTFINNPQNGDDYAGKEDISGQDCADAGSWNDRMMPEFSGDTEFCFVYAVCTDGSCETTPVVATVAPWSENFNQINDGSGWSLEIGQPGGWALMNNGESDTGTDIWNAWSLNPGLAPGDDTDAYTLYHDDDETGGAGNVDNWIITPFLDCTQLSEPMVSFVEYQSYATSWYVFHGVYYSEDYDGTNKDTATWTELQNGPAPVGEPTTVEHAIPSTTTAIAWRYQGDYADNWFIDDVVVGDALSTTDAEILDMRIYPNPVDGNYVTIQSPIQGLKEIEVYTVTGRKVLQTVLTDDRLDVSSFNSGFYMVKVTINGQSKLSKLVVR